MHISAVCGFITIEGGQISAIKNIRARQILDSRGNPTVEVDVITQSGLLLTSSVPAGSAEGSLDAFQVEIPQAISNITGPILQNLRGQEVVNQEQIDKVMIELDGTPNKENLGGNATLGVSLAVAKAGAKEQNIPLYQYLARMIGMQASLELPTPLLNIINGGEHARNNLPFQEFMIAPIAEGLNFSQRLAVGIKIFRQLGKNLAKLNQSTAVGEEGGFAPDINTNDEAIELLVEAISESGFTPGKDIAIAIDVAANFIPDLSAISYPVSPMEYYQKLLSEYPIVMLEDPFRDNDIDNWQTISADADKITVVGDDLFSTNSVAIERGAKQKLANAVSIKPNQRGTLTETVQAIKTARQNNIQIQVSHRSGETEDTFIADLAVGAHAKYFKAGAPNRGERVAKYNQILRIEESLRQGN